MAQTLAARKRQRIDPDQGLIGLGAADLGAAFTGGLPVTAGSSRSIVNYDAGAETPAAGAFTALGLALAALFLTPLIHSPPASAINTGNSGGAGGAAADGGGQDDSGQDGGLAG